MTEGIVFNIQRFSTHDGPGIRTVVFFQGCPLRCVWCQNPESQSFVPVIMQKKELCVGCGACKAVCPKNAVRLENAISYIDRMLCDGCGACAAHCRQGALTVSGRRIKSDEVVEEILKDRSYYLNSQGGVTLSGGEATAQPEFALDILKKCRSRCINTALETSGFTSETVMREFIPVTDLFLFDIKTVDSAAHVRGTVKDNSQILKNAKMLAGADCNLRIRMPLIPGFNDTPDDVLALRSFVETQLHLSSDHIELLKYNPLGEVKFERLGRQIGISGKPQSDEYFEQLNGLLR